MMLALIIFLGFFATYAMRGFAMVFFSKITVPVFVRRALPFVPICVLSALVSPAVFAPNGALSFSPWLVAACAAGFSSVLRKDLYSLIIVGTLAFFALYSL